MSWLNDYVRQHSEFEAPISFYFWGGLSAISAVIKDRIWMDRYIYKLYGNIYVMLHADSGMKKGPPVNAARKLVASAIGDTSIITGRSSIQGILKEMGTARTLPNGKVEGNNASFICSSELTSSLVDDPVATMILTDLYDRNYNDDNWKSLLKMESFKIKNPTITMLTATNEAMSEDFFTKSAVRGGYFARTFIIHESHRNMPNSLLVPPKEKIDYKASADYLKHLATIKGEFKALGSRTHCDDFPYSRYNKYVKETHYFSKAGIVYEDWYDEFINLIDAQEMKDETGTLNRFGDSVLKVALLMSLAERPDLELTEEIMYEAIKMCEKLVGNARRATMGKNGTANTAMLKSMIILELLGREAHSISKPLLMKKLWMHFSGEHEFNDVMLSMHNSGAVLTKNPNNTVIIYEMPETQVEEYKKLMAGKIGRKQ